MTYDEAMAKLEALGDEKVHKQYSKKGDGDKMFGVKSADLRDMAKQINNDPKLASELWKSGNVDAMMLAVLIVKPKDLTAGELEQMVSTSVNMRAADWLNSYVVKQHPQKEELRRKWMGSNGNMWTVKAGWSLTTERVGKNPDGLDISHLLDRIEAEMGGAPEPLQWSMNFCLIDIGIKFPAHRERAIAIGERLGVFRGYPVSKGCTSPFAPIAIPALAGRQ